jgi:Tfp pilus assembly protein FimT
MKQNPSGHSLLELLLVILILGTLAGIAVPKTQDFVQGYRLRGASLYMRSLIRQVRSQAAAKNRYQGIVFDEVDGQMELSIHLDGNNNGIRRADIRSGTDQRIRGPWLLSSVFPGVRYGTPPVGAGPAFPGLRFGRSRILSFSPIGKSTSGTLFLSNEHGQIHAVVVLGATGRVRTARYRGGRWEPVW